MKSFFLDLSHSISSFPLSYPILILSLSSNPPHFFINSLVALVLSRKKEDGEDGRMKDRG